MKDLRERVTRGFGWVLGSTVAGRLIQLAALAITTILLTPEDFGLLAVVTASTMLIERLTTFGLDGALVQSREVTRRMLNVAWSYQLTRNLILGVGTFFAAPWLAALFREPAAEQMIRVAAVAFPLSGARNIGLVELRRRLDFKRLGYVNLIPLLVHAPTAVALTLVWRNVWALVCASLAMVAAGLVVSYCFAPHRPRLDFHWATARPLFSFGLCLLGNTMLQTIREQGVVLVVARTMGNEALGYYNRGLAFSFTLFVQAQEMFWRVMFPALSQIQAESGRLREVWRKLTLGAVLAGVGGGACYLLVAPWAVRWVLGEQWLPMVPLMQLFGVYAVLTAISTPSEVLFQAMGRPAIGTRFQLVSTVIVAALLWPAVKWGGLAGVACAFVGAAAIVTPVTLWAASRLLLEHATKLSSAATPESAAVDHQPLN